MNGRTAAIVLAAGGARRFADGHKLLAPFRGRALVTWAAEAAEEAALDETIVVVGDTLLTDVLPGSVTVVPNPDWEGGIATSLWAGLHEAAGFDAVVVGLADQPGALVGGAFLLQVVGPVSCRRGGTARSCVCPTSP